MSTEKRLVLFLLLSVATMYGMQILLDQLNLLPKPPERPPAVEAPRRDKVPAALPGPTEVDVPLEAAADPLVDRAEAESQRADAESAEAAAVSIAEPEELTLGSIDPGSPYHLRIRLDQRGAGVAALSSSHYEAEIQDGQPRGRALELIRERPGRKSLPSFALNVLPKSGDDLLPEESVGVLKDADTLLDGPFNLQDRDWEVVRDEQGRAVRAVQQGREGEPNPEGQELSFRTSIKLGDSPLSITKTYRLWPGQDGFELVVAFESSAQHAEELSYTLLGPRSLPIEGEWYTATFRDTFFGLVAPGGIEVETISAYDVFKNARPGFTQQRFTSPLAFAGVENQYFAVFAQPVPIPTTAEDSPIREAVPVPVGDPGDDWQKADVSVVLRSRPFDVGMNQPFTQSYRIYAGPKSVDALTLPYGAEELATYRKGWHLWVVGDLGASFMSKWVIRPLLKRTYALTEQVSGLFGGTRGNWGVAIILLTVIVRLVLFPLGRKQARTAQKMQQLQPLMVELKEKYKDDKEKLTQETFALYKRYGVNPLGGCLPALVQLPVLIGLWQTLNNSVDLRHSSFLWIDNLAAPDQLFKFPFTIPLVGTWLGPYFNVLPIVVVILMLIQTKLFSPPATTPEAEQQQKMMKYMMVFMAFIFYKVPSGLGIYFITSSLWQVGERLLVPKVDLQPKGSDGPGPTEQGAKPRPKIGPSDGNGAGGRTGWLSDLRSKAQQILDDAEKQRTVRNTGNPGEGKPGRERERERNRPKPRPGRKR